MIESFRALAEQAGHAELWDGFYPDTTPENPRNPLTAVFDDPQNPAGRTVTENTAMQVTAVWRCVTIIAGTLAKVPFLPYQLVEEGKERATKHYLWPLFTRRANPYMSSYRLKRLMQAWCCLWGNAFAEVQINGRGQVVALWPWRPDRVEVEGAGIAYTYTMPSGERLTLPRDRILHIRGIETDGCMGLSPIKQARVTLGLAKSAEEYGARFFSNNGRPGGVLESPNVLSDKAHQRLRQGYETIHKGLRGAHRIAILEDGLKYKEVGLPPEDMQFLQTREFEAIDIARLFGVPPHMIAELRRATFSNIEHQGIEFVNGTMMDWFCNWESECQLQLLSQRDAERIVLKFFPEGLLMGDLLTRYRAYSIGRQGGWLNANEIRDKEDMNHIEGGDVYLQMLNMTPVAEDDAASLDPNDPVDDGEDDAAGDDDLDSKKAKQKKKAKKAADAAAAEDDDGEE